MGMFSFEYLKNKYNLNIKGIIHVGAHKGEEVDEYFKCGVSNIILVEPIPYICDDLKTRLKHTNIKIFQLALSDVNGESDFYVTNHTMSSSLLKLKYHKVIEPNVVEIEKISVITKRFETLVEENNIIMDDYNFLTIDVQGAELLVLKGFGDLLKNIDYIVSEINREELYDKCALESDIDNMLLPMNFIKQEECFEVPTWGDIFYVRR